MYEAVVTIQHRDEKGRPVVYIKGTKFEKNVPQGILDEYKSGSGLVKKLSAPKPGNNVALPKSQVSVTGKSIVTKRKKL